jgi:hypothetical protein
MPGNEICRRWGLRISRRTSVVASFLLLPLILPLSFAQNPTASSKEPSEMIVTSEGLLAIQTPEGWVRTEGPGLAFFVRQGESLETADVSIYISSAPIGPHEDAKDFQTYIKSDIAGFKERFKGGVVRKEASIKLPHVKSAVPVYTFESAEKRNSFEEVIYIPEADRVLILALSAKNKDAFAKFTQDFRGFAESYGGSIRETETKHP